MSRAGAGVRARFVATILLGSFLLFLVQPMVARLALPRLGGAPAVWNSAMLVYQALLLAGYAYAHWLGARAPRNQPVIHLALFAVAGLTLPIGLIAAFPSADASPFLWVPWLLLASVGPLFFVVAAQAPLVQRWYALAGGGDPYPLYAASNFGSFAGLLSYPLLVEPMLSVGAQRWLWSIGYVLLAALVLWCARALPQDSADERAAAAPRAAPPPWRERLAWIALAAVPSGLILSTTLHLSTDIGALPLLWVIPLGLYLLSFTLAFSARAGPARFFSLLAPVLLLTTACGLFADSRGMAVLFGIVALAALFAVSVALHRQLFDRRPEPAQLTLFYLLLSVGGALGGLFAALIAPLLFNWTAEHPLLLLAAAALLAARSPFERAANLWDASPTSRTVTALLVALLLVLALAGKGLFGLPYSSTVSSYALFAILAVGIVAIGNRLLLTAAIAALMLNVGGWERIELSLQQGALTRSYFGVYTVRPKSDGGRWLIHGTTVHGIQNLGTAERERTPTSYYVPEAGVGRALGAAARLFGPAARIGIVGLGAGTLACYARPGQRWTFFEIDPVVVRIARDSGQFTFLARCTPRVPIVLGDARISLANAAPGSLDLLVVDAFSSDSVPLHLLTAEAFAVYRRALSERGLLLVHVSNRYFRLQPAVAAAARAGGWSARELNFSPTDKRRSDNATGSMWVALSPSAQSIRQLTADDPRAWKPLPVQRGFEAWTDDHASVLPLIRWR